MSGTRSKRHLNNSITPRRSERIRESPVIDYSSPSLQLGASSRSKRGSQTRSRSKSRVLKDSHPPGEDEFDYQAAKRRLQLNPRLECLSDNEEGELEEYAPNAMKKVVTQEVLGVFDASTSITLATLTQRIRDYSMEAVDAIKSAKIPDITQMKYSVKSISPKKVGLGFLAVVLLYLLSILLFTDILSGALIPVTSLLFNARMAILSVPDLIVRRNEVIEGTPVDYDTLVIKILDSQKFTALVEDMTLQHRHSLEVSLHEAIDTELAGLKQRTEQIDKGIHAQVRQEIDLVKQMLKVNSDKVTKENENLREVNRQEVDKLKDNLALLEAQLHNLANAPSGRSTSNQVEGEANDNPQVQSLTTGLVTLTSRLGHLESKLPQVRSQIESCCNNKPDLRVELESRLEQILSNFSSPAVQTVTSLFVDREDFQADRQNIDLQLNMLRDSMIEKVKSESDSMNTKIEELRTALKDRKNEVKENIEPASDLAQTLRQSEYVEEIVKAALAKYDADKTGLFDFALESAGGSILSTRCTESYEGSSAVLSVMGVPIWWETNNPRSILQPGMAPGQCWAFRGSTGAVVVKLSATIIVKAVSIEHISLRSTPDGQISSAPKAMTLSGINGEDIFPLANFTYEKSGDPVQTFSFQSQRKLDTVELNVLSNHGHPDYTCIYRFRVHGDPAEDDKIH